MSQSVPPPPPSGNPFADNAYPQAPAPAPARDNVGLGVVAAFAAALVASGIYGAIYGATEYQIGIAAIAVGYLTGLAAGKAGGGNPALPVVSAILTLGAVYLGQLLGFAILLADVLHLGVAEVFFQNFQELTSIWKEEAGPMTFLFLAIGAYAAFSAAKKSAS
ncbi:hypothetical protein AR457_14400 [Streptomyces agglomeratus]|uniref:Uncharacterized protein n=1 Tax=Streptomyces agglomeratus TaxID=285458 RepID=A0A1E5P7E2_9ACTN|nr:hypothetical protein [Streptomyces agglomeratus]OEJ25471.1 hypothetical protein AS594_14215 [Streptomyces agglomeratus]OEJ40490.1 hypothetical protein BGK70_22255 [Streptomyces agglomeratus]OEJ45130.1 hypothetical protein AR457_14400 [Streptomyces agglomeratus]OEJ53041.1 hypothetical protein BGK72_21895 [Streptomyces agglomeratus]OEJ60377.1 hypothetical protein BGM19_22595 [Streptomyces agglomeratus]